MISRFPRLLYLLEREDGALKVGSSSFPAQRMRDLEEEQGHNFVLLRELEHPNAWALEMQIHRILRRQKGVEFCDFGGWETYVAPKAVVMKVIKDEMAQWGKKPRKVRPRCGTCQHWHSRPECNTYSLDKCDLWMERENAQ